MRAVGRCMRIIALLALLAVCLAGCTAPVIHLPTPTSRPDQNPAQGTVIAPVPQERRVLFLEWPTSIPTGDSDLITLTIEMGEGGALAVTVSPPSAASPTPTPGSTPFEIPNIYDTHNIFAVARLDMAGMEYFREEIRESLVPGQPLTFRWSIRASDAGVYRGVVWLHLELVPKDGSAVDRRLILARPVEIRAVTVLGMSGSLARILGGLGLLASTILGFPFIQRWIEARFKGRKGGPPGTNRVGEAGSSAGPSDKLPDVDDKSHKDDATLPEEGSGG